MNFQTWFIWDPCHSTKGLEIKGKMRFVKCLVNQWPTMLEKREISNNSLFFVSIIKINFFIFFLCLFGCCCFWNSNQYSNVSLVWNPCLLHKMLSFSFFCLSLCFVEEDWDDSSQEEVRSNHNPKHRKPPPLVNVLQTIHKMKCNKTWNPKILHKREKNTWVL